MRRFVIVSAALVMACGRQVQVATAPAVPARADITSADQLLTAMRDRHASRWYRTITFVQKSTYYRPDGSVSRVETWYEAGAIPGRLRIDIGDPSRGTGVLYRNDSVYSVDRGRIVARQKGRNPLLILGFDAYAQPVARTMEQLRAEGVNMSLLRVDSLAGRRMYVVGAGPRDSTSNQFWIDADRLLFARLIQTDTARRRTQDIRFDKYAAYDSGWVAEEVRVLIGGRLMFHEEYSSVRVNVPLDEQLFIPEQWTTATHWYKP